jgi:hypothetical protein
LVLVARIQKHIFSSRPLRNIFKAKFSLPRLLFSLTRNLVRFSSPEFWPDFFPRFYCFLTRFFDQIEFDIFWPEKKSGQILALKVVQSMVDVAEEQADI